MPAVFDEKGYHFFAIQEAHEQHMLQLQSHNWVLQSDQCIVARKTNEAQTIDHGGNQKIGWHVAEFVDQPRLGLKSLVIMSLHISNIYVKRANAGPVALQEAIDAGIKACADARRPSLDIVCADARRPSWHVGEKGDSALWHDTTYDVLELRGVTPVSDWLGECCFAGVRETWIQQLQIIKGSS